MVSAIILAAGLGKRFRHKVQKPLAKINSKPIIAYSLETLDKCALISEIIVVVNAGNKAGIKKAIEKYLIKKAGRLVLGGARRQDSVRNGLEAVSSRADLVLIHDSARPFVDREMVSRAIAAARRVGSAIVGVPVKATIKRVKRQGAGAKVEKTLNRENLWEIQTPQVFRKDLILRAHKKFGRSDVTDDAMLVEKLGASVAIVLGSYRNIKVTTAEDLIIAKALAK